MKNPFLCLAPLIVCFTVTAAALPQGGPIAGSLDNIDTSGSPDGIVPLPGTVHPTITNVFDRYTKITADNGNPIHFLIHANVSNAKVAHARRILEQHMTDVPGSTYGSDKRALRESMGNLRATMMFFPTIDSLENGGPQVDQFLDDYEAPLQDLLGDEIILPGSVRYVGPNPERDASYEELVHLMHGYGLIPTMPALQRQIESAASHAVSAGLYSPPPGLPAADIPFEYLAFTMETWYGMWAHEPNNGEYVFSSRLEMEAGDPNIVSILEGFFPPFHSHRAEVVATFSGTFHAREASNLEYSFKSRYLNHVELLGTANTALRGNREDGTLVGNSGNNRMQGAGGQDHLDGQAGFDTGDYIGPQADYGVYLMDGILTVEDTVPNRDGLDRLVNFEQLQFIDGAVQLDTYVDTASHYCASTANSTGAPAQIHVVGSPLVSHQDLSLTASNLPSSQFGYFLCSQSPGLIVGPGGSQGNLCLGGVIGRFVTQVQMSGSDGTMGIDVNMAAMPDPAQAVIQPGETWHFACWFRDLDPTPTSNFTGGVSVQFQ
jgi:hypothetical protein